MSVNVQRMQFSADVLKDMRKEGTGISIPETQKVASSKGDVNYKKAAKNERMADAISVIMDPEFGNEVRNDEEKKWRFVKSEGIERLLKLGNYPDKDGFLYYYIVRDGKDRGIYCVPEYMLDNVPLENYSMLHKSSIEERIKNKEPLAFGGGFYYYGDRLGFYGVYCGAGVSQMAQFEQLAKRGAQKIAGLLRAGQTIVLRSSSSGKKTKLTADEDLEVIVK